MYIWEENKFAQGVRLEQEKIVNTVKEEGGECANRILARRYKVCTESGKGGFGNVYKVYDLHIGKYFAAKRVLEGGDICKEKHWMGMFSHPGLPTLHDYIEDEGETFLIMEYVEGETLYEYVKRNGSLDCEECLVLAEELAEILCYLHSLPTPVFYGDLKPSNIIYQKDKPVTLIDFGTTSFLKGERKEGFYSEGYTAPEALGGEHFLSSDIYSFGKVMQFAVSGRNPTLQEMAWDEKEWQRYGIKDKFAQILSICCKDFPEERFESAIFLKQALDISEIRGKRKRTGTVCATFFRVFGWFYVLIGFFRAICLNPIWLSFGEMNLSVSSVYCVFGAVLLLLAHFIKEDKRCPEIEILSCESSIFISESL